MVTHTDTHRSKKSRHIPKVTDLHRHSLLNMQYVRLLVSVCAYGLVCVCTNWIGLTGSSKPIQHIQFAFPVPRGRHRGRMMAADDSPQFVFRL